jgi:carboxyl-terminal processing protease
MFKKVNKRITLPVFALTVLFLGSSFKSDFFEIAKQIEIFTTLFKELNMNYVDETNPAELMDSAIKNMLGELDPYTTFLNEQDVEEYKINNRGEYSGIGALVRAYKDRLVIVEPYEGYPADKAGLKAGDEIIKIGDILVADFSENATELLKGSNKSSVEVTFKRQGQTETTTLTRKGIEINAVPFYEMADEKTGYIVLSKFNSKASTETENALRDLKNKGAERFILDLRGNPGGLLSEAINVTNLFVPKNELIVTTKSKVKKFNNTYKTNNKPFDTEIPLVVLIDGKSASASEIVSGSLQDLDRAVIMGARSFGKGLVQRPMKLTYGTQLKVTISRYYTPSGRCIQALDYWNRDENGQAVRNTEYQQFKTRNGRKVEDGGGIMPDVAIPSLHQNDFTNALENNHLIFDFATEYHYQHSFEKLTDFALTQEDFSSFKEYVLKRGFDFETKTETALKNALTDPKDIFANGNLKGEFESLLAHIQNDKANALEGYRDQLTKSLEDEIVKRYFYREGLYQYYLGNDMSILTAKELLKDADAYQKLLK